MLILKQGGTITCKSSFSPYLAAYSASGLSKNSNWLDGAAEAFVFFMLSNVYLGLE